VLTRRNPTFLFLLVVLSSAPLLAAPAGAERADVGRKKDGIAAKTGKAKSVAELVAMYDSSSCVECHGEIHEAWSKSIHARSIYGTGRTAATLVNTVNNGLMQWPASGVKETCDVRVEHLMVCAKCHLPQLADAEDSVAKEIVASLFRWQDAIDDDDAAAVAKEEPLLKSLNINCLVCHNRNAVTHKWAYGYPKAGVVYGAKDGAHESKAFPEMKKSAGLAESSFCGQCHGLGPNMELDEPTQCATAYGSYLWAYRAEGGKEQCQDCHMRKSGLGHNMQSYRDPGMAKAAVDFETDITGMLWRDGSRYVPKTVVKVAMTNRTGHSIPDG
jgi:hypothetical protein